MITFDDDIIQQLRATFKIEADEHIQAMNRILLDLEKGVDDDRHAKLLEEIFREAHSLKGAAGAVDLRDVEATGHKLESLLDATRSGTLSMSPELFDLLYESVDAVSVMVEKSLDDQPHGVDLADLHQRLADAQQGKFVLLPASAPVASVVEVPAPGPEPECSAPVASASAEPLASASAAPAPPKAPTPQRAAGPHTSRNGGGPHLAEETIRVSTSKLDVLMTQAGELLVAGLKIDQRVQEIESANHFVEEWHREWLKTRASLSSVLRDEAADELLPLVRFMDQSQQRLRSLGAQLSDLRRGFSSDALHLSRVTTDLGEEVMRVRMLPVSTVFDTFPRLVRDLSREMGKEIELVIEGGETELDRKVLEEIKDPLIHIIRNSADHGIEMPAAREANGKARLGTITLSAYQKGNSIVIQVSDNGGGIDVERVKASALKRGTITAEEAATMSDEDATGLIFASGLSTAAKITDISGRGVGMDVVRRNIESLHGTVDVESVLGEGTTMRLTLPLTLATTQELLVQVGGQIFGIPIDAVERIQRIDTDDIATVEGTEAIVVDGEPISLVRLAAVLELLVDADTDAPTKRPIVILRAGRKRIAFLVDAVVAQQESVVKSLGKQLKRVRNVSGATILGTGQVIMVLNPADLISSAKGVSGGSATVRRVAPDATKAPSRPSVMVVDDSLTTRNLEKAILETAGYDVTVATDGVEALGMLQSMPYDIVISDVLMPQMDGFELTSSIRSDPALADTPVILVTSLESRQDRERGIEVGASAYIVKSTFDQENLLQAIEQLV